MIVLLLLKIGLFWITVMASSSEDTLHKTLEQVETYLTEKIGKCHGDKEQSKDLFRVVWFVQKETEDAIKQYGNSPVTKYIAKLIKTGKENIIDMYLRNVIEDAKTAESEPEFRKFMSDLYISMNKDVGVRQEEDQIKEQAYTALLKGTAIAFSRMTPKVLSQVLEAIEGLPLVDVVFKPLGENVKLGGKKYIVQLAAVELGLETLRHIHLWWKGEISGKLCAKGILDSFAGVVGGVGGGHLGSVVGNYAGPYGMIAGAAFGAVAGQYFGQAVMEKITCTIFDLPKTAALDNAYLYLNIPHDAPNEDVNRAYRKKALISHPDKGGKTEDFLELQLKYAIIKAARGDIV